ncbi:hypothetical protein D3C87_2075760 [compost metagenome]
MAVPGTVSWARSDKLAAFSAGVRIAGVMMSSTRDLIMLLKAPPITTPTARSITLPFIANSLNSLINPIIFVFFE